MRRRDLLAGLLAATTVGTVRAQQPSSKVWRVAFFYPGTMGDPEREVVGVFRSELRTQRRVRGRR